MIKYLVGLTGEQSFLGEPFYIIRAKNRDAAVKKYDEHMTSEGRTLPPGQEHFGLVIGVMTIFGPMNLVPRCTRDLATMAGHLAKELEE